MLMKIKTNELIFVEILETLACLLDHYSRMCSLQATSPGANNMSEHSAHWSFWSGQMFIGCRFYLSRLHFSLMEMEVFYLRVASNVVRLEMGSGVVLASILLPKEPLNGWLKRDSLSSFPPSGLIYYTQWVSGMRGELPWLGPWLGFEWPWCQ